MIGNLLILELYFFSASSWILNLGVVPLFRFSVFLLAPVFLAFNTLLALVIFEFETIRLLLSGIIYYKSKCYIHAGVRSVKILIKLTTLFIFWGPHCHTIQAKSTIPPETTFENIIISKGEHREMALSGITKFTIGNHEIISHKFNSKNGQLLVKGTKLGFTELVIWKGHGAKQVFRIYVLAKTKHLKILHLAQTIRSLGLIVNLAGPLIIALGTVRDFHDYQLLKRLERENPKVIHLKINQDQSLKNHIISQVYHALFNEYVDDISCREQYGNIYCYYPKTNPPSKKTLTFLKSKYFVIFLPKIQHTKFQNYIAKLKIIQLEKLDGRELGLGLDKISASLQDVFHKGIKGLVEENRLILSSNRVHLSTLADPEIILRPNTKAFIKVGAQIPYTQQSSTDPKYPKTSWKFAGLSIALTLKEVGSKLIIKFKTEISRPENQGKAIFGNSESSEVIINPKKPLQLFQIGLRTEGKNTSAMPWLGKIPILGNIFKSMSQQANYKKISCIIVLERHGA